MEDINRFHLINNRISHWENKYLWPSNRPQQATIYSIITWAQSVKCRWNDTFLEFSEWPERWLYILVSVQDCFLWLHDSSVKVFLRFRSTVRTTIPNICLTILGLIFAEVSLDRIHTATSWNHPRGVRTLNEPAPTKDVTHTHNRVNNNALIAKIN